MNIPAPLFTHDCDTCTFIGTRNGEDIYNHGDEVIRRFGNDGPEYLCMPRYMARRVPAYQEAEAMIAAHWGAIVTGKEPLRLIAYQSGDGVQNALYPGRYAVLSNDPENFAEAREIAFAVLTLVESDADIHRIHYAVELRNGDLIEFAF